MNYNNLRNYGLKDAHIKEAEGINFGYLGRVCSQHHDIYTVMTEDGLMKGEVLGKLIYDGTFPVVGDWVLVDRTDDRNGNGIIHKILSRKSVLQRKAAGTANELQIIVSNVDKIFICMSLNDDFNLRRVERYLTVAWDSGAIPVILLTKGDLCSDLSKKIEEVQQISPGVDIFVTASSDQESYLRVKNSIQPGETVVFVGSSGVGKSTLINGIIGENLFKTKEIRAGDHKGKHTTTFRQLIALENGGVVIDTPGMRELQIHTGDISKSFDDIEQLAAGCRYRNCTHENEQGCRIIQALQDGTLDAKRYSNYKKLQLELLYEGMNSKQVEEEKLNRFFAGKKEYKKFRDYYKNKNR